jgi:hypothetical protein
MKPRRRLCSPALIPGKRAASPPRSRSKLLPAPTEEERLALAYEGGKPRDIATTNNSYQERDQLSTLRTYIRLHVLCARLHTGVAQWRLLLGTPRGCPLR